MSLDSVELVMRFEEVLEIQIPNDVAATLSTPRDVIDYAAGRLVGTASAGGRPWTRERIAAAVRDAVIDSAGLDPREYREDGHFVEDFGID